MPLLRFIPETTNVEFVKYRFVAFAIDGLLVLVSVISIFWHGFNLGIDFTGGVLMEVKSAQVIDVGRMRGEIISLGFNDPVVQTFGGPGCDQPAGSCAISSWNRCLRAISNATSPTSHGRFGTLSALSMRPACST